MLVAVEKDDIIGVCFRTYNTQEKWADLQGLVVKEKHREKEVGSTLVKEFEKIAKSKKLTTIDLYADENQVQFFKKSGYEQGRT